MFRRFASVLALLIASPLAFAGAAQADVPPPPGFVETCTVAQQQTGGARCEECRASFQDASACATRFASTQMQQRCKTSGASVWTEVWCETRVATDPTAPAPAPTPAPAPEAPPATSVSAEQADASSCAVASPGASRASGLALFGLVAALGVALRRRARR
jgi:MYXO-CTERM domain-containing protein